MVTVPKQNNPTAPEVGMVRCPLKGKSAIAEARCELERNQHGQECRDKKCLYAPPKFPWKKSCEEADPPHKQSKSGEACLTCMGKSNYHRDKAKKKTSASRAEKPKTIAIPDSDGVKEYPVEPLPSELEKLEKKLKDAEGKASRLETELANLKEHQQHLLDTRANQLTSIEKLQQEINHLKAKNDSLKQELEEAQDLKQQEHNADLEAAWTRAEKAEKALKETKAALDYWQPFGEEAKSVLDLTIRSVRRNGFFPFAFAWLEDFIAEPKQDEKHWPKPSELGGSK